MVTVKSKITSGFIVPAGINRSAEVADESKSYAPVCVTQPLAAGEEQLQVNNADTSGSSGSVDRLALNSISFSELTSPSGLFNSNSNSEAMTFMSIWLFAV